MGFIELHMVCVSKWCDCRAEQLEVNSEFMAVSCAVLFDLRCYSSYGGGVFIHIHNGLLMNVTINKQKQELF